MSGSVSEFATRLGLLPCTIGVWPNSRIDSALPNCRTIAASAEEQRCDQMVMGKPTTPRRRFRSVAWLARHESPASDRYSGGAYKGTEHCRTYPITLLE